MEVKEWNHLVAGYLRQVGVPLSALVEFRTKIFESQKIHAKMFFADILSMGGISREIFETFLNDATRRREMVSALDDYIEHFENADGPQGQEHPG